MRPVAPRVAKPQRRQDVQRRCCGAAIGYLDAHENVFWRGLAVLDDHVEISIVRKDARVEKLVLGVGLPQLKVQVTERLAPTGLAWATVGVVLMLVSLVAYAYLSGVFVKRFGR